MTEEIDDSQFAKDLKRAKGLMSFIREEGKWTRREYTLVGLGVLGGLGIAGFVIAILNYIAMMALLGWW